jgi:GNAT superfamily N-acetyltransferase
MGMAEVDGRQVATIVTHLEMRTRPKPAPIPDAPLRLIRWKTPALDKYRTLFTRVGAPWLWFSRLVLPDMMVEAIIHDEQVHIYALCDPRGIEIGLLELDFRSEGVCSIAFLGLVPQLIGKGFGRWLMAQTMLLAWPKDVNLVRVHTCTLDHPGALGLYLKTGFIAVRREVETFDDPRLTGILPRDAAPHIPFMDQASI